MISRPRFVPPRTLAITPTLTTFLHLYRLVCDKTMSRLTFALPPQLPGLLCYGKPRLVYRAQGHESADGGFVAPTNSISTCH